VIRPLPHGIALYFAGMQFLFALGWTVYVLFLPELLDRAGIERTWTPWIIALDQFVFAFADLAMGAAMDRARRALRTVGGWLVGLITLSSLAMLAMPAATRFGAAAFLALTLVWVAASAALRAPSFVLLGRYAARSALPWLAGMVLIGLAAASALAPYLAMHLKSIDPALPFAIASLAILASASGLVAAERRLISHAEGHNQAGTPLPFGALAARLLFVGLLLAVFGFQCQIALNAATQITRVASAAQLPWLLPVFWVGFAFGFLLTARLGQLWGEGRAAALACAVGALALVVAALATSVPVLMVSHALGGAAWAIVLANAIAMMAACGHHGAEGRYLGILFSLLALGTLGRIALMLAGVPAILQTGTDWIAVAAWGGAALLLLLAARGMPPRSSPP